MASMTFCKATAIPAVMSPAKVASEPISVARAKAMVIPITHHNTMRRNSKN